MALASNPVCCIVGKELCSQGDMTPSEALTDALAKFGDSPTALAVAIGGSVKRQNIEHWMRSGRVPAEHCPGVERSVHGAVSCEALRPDLTWRRVRDKVWPWNGGRPLLDLSQTEAA
jgi:DNA-binding transcriptional regulator YdaS (Cro superfamily)